MGLFDRIRPKRRSGQPDPGAPPGSTFTEFGERVPDVVPSRRAGGGRTAHGLRVAVWVCLTRKKCLEKVRGLDASQYVSEGILFRRYPIDGLEKFRQVCPPKRLRASAVLSHLYCLIMTIILCLRERPHLCVGISLVPHMILAKVGQFVSGARFATWFIGGPDMDAQMARRAWRATVGPFVRNADCTLCMGVRSRQRLIEWGWPPRRVLVGRNAYDLTAYRSTEGPKEWDLIYTGNLKHEHKRLDILVQAVDIARKRLPDLKCALVGDGPYRGELEAMVAQRSLANHVLFLGRQEDVPAFLARARALIMTSEWEGCPASVVEAFAAGVPAVIPDVGDILTFARDGYNSLIVTTQDPADYAAAIVRILTNDDVYARLKRGAIESGRAIEEATSGPNLSATWNRVILTALSGRIRTRVAGEPRVC